MKNEKDDIKEKIRMIGLVKKKIEQEELKKYRNTDALYDSIFRMTYFTKMLKNETLTDVEKEYFNKQKDNIMEDVYSELKKPIYTPFNITPDENETLEIISSTIEEIWGTYAEEFFNRYSDLKQRRLEYKATKRKFKVSERKKRKNK